MVYLSHFLLIENGRISLTRHLQDSPSYQWCLEKLISDSSYQEIWSIKSLKPVAFGSESNCMSCRFKTSLTYTNNLQHIKRACWQTCVILYIFGSVSTVAGKHVPCIIMFHTGWGQHYAVSHTFSKKINIIFTISMQQATFNYYNSSVDCISKVTILHFCV